MTEPEVTIVVVPRERFSAAQETLELLFEHTDVPFELVYVDGNSPRRVGRYLERMARERGFLLVRSDRYLSPTSARNLGLRFVNTKYVAFVDNDLLTTPGWLSPLLACAEETGAWLVDPLSFEGDPQERTIHIAGGDLELVGEPGKRSFTDTHQHQEMRLDELEEPLTRQPAKFAEFHCMLARTDRLREIGGLDEHLLSSREHLDVSLRVREAGGEIYNEPASQVFYRSPPPLKWSDVPFYMQRWSERWNIASIDHFTEKWGIDPSYRMKGPSLRWRRRIVAAPVRGWIGKRLGKPVAYAFSVLLHRAEPIVNRLMFRSDGKPVLVRVLDGRQRISDS